MDSFQIIDIAAWQDHPECGAFARAGFQFEAAIEEFRNLVVELKAGQCGGDRDLVCIFGGFSSSLENGLAPMFEMRRQTGQLRVCGILHFSKIKVPGESAGRPVWAMEARQMNPARSNSPPG